MAQTHAPIRRLITSLGTQPEYRMTRYVWPETGEAIETRYIAHALAKLHEAYDEVFVIATDAAWAAHGAQLTAIFAEDGLPTPTHRPISEGGSAQELWGQFQTLIEALRAGPGDHVCFDITLGFRAMPFLAATAISYVRAIDDTPSAHSVVYGAFIFGQPETMIWDVTPAVEVVDWAQALQMFLKTGRAAQIRTLTEPLGLSRRKQWAIHGRHGARPSIAKLAERFEQFSQDFATVRTGSLLLNTSHDSKSTQGSAAELAYFIEQARDEVDEHLPPLAAVLDRVAAMIDGLSAEELASEQGIRALSKLAGLYLQTERYAEAAALTQEGHITRYAVPGQSNPGTNGCIFQARDKAKSRWKLHEDASSKISQIRNDIEHAGFRDQPKSSRSLISKLRDIVDAFQKENFVGALERTQGEAVFVNLSNHPSPEWSDTQRQAALACAPDLTQIIDVPFPAVEPDADEAQITSLVNALCESIPEGASYAMVSGEYTLTFALVRALQRQGITCVAATTRREVFVDEASGDTLRRFTFARFREYAR